VEKKSAPQRKSWLRVRASGRYAVQGQSRSVMLVPIESPFTTYY